MLRGTFEGLDLGAIIRCLAGEKPTGRMQVAAPPDRWTVLIENGRICGVHTEETSSVDNDLVAEMSRLLLSEPSEFSWRNEPVDVLHPGMDARELLEGAYARAERLSAVRSQLASPGSLVKMSAAPPAQALSISPAEWELIVLIGAGQSLTQLANGLGKPVQEVTELVGGLLDRGLVEVATAQPTQAAGTPNRPVGAPPPSPPPKAEAREPAGPRQEPTADRLKIAVICTGNRIRSPLFQALLERYLHDLPVRIESWGIDDIGLRLPVPEAVAAGAELGLDLSNHVSRSLEGGALTTADLVIGFESAHLQAARSVGGARPETIFGCVELAELLEQVELDTDEDGVELARKVIRLARERRGHLPPPRAFARIQDPLGMGWASFRHMARMLDSLAERIAGGLRGTSRTPLWLGRATARKDSMA